MKKNTTKKMAWSFSRGRVAVSSYKKDELSAEHALHREEIEEMFKPVIENVIGLIKGQIESAKQENALPTTVRKLRENNES